MPSYDAVCLKSSRVMNKAPDQQDMNNEHTKYKRETQHSSGPVPLSTRSQTFSARFMLSELRQPTLNVTLTDPMLATPSEALDAEFTRYVSGIGSLELTS